MRITGISRQKKNRERFSVFLDGEYAFSLSEEGLLRHHLKEGGEIEKCDIERIAAEEEGRDALDSAFRLLGIRSRSEEELVRRLKQKRFSAAAVEHAMSRVKELGYVNDARFAHDWARYRQQQGKGPQLIKAELKLKGIAPEILSEVVAGMKESAGSEAEQVKDLAERKLKQLKGLPPRTVAHRLTGFLARRGFSIDAIHEALRELRLSEKEDDSD